MSSLRDQWWSIEDWAEANGIPEENWEAALDEGISHNDDDTIDIPDSYPYEPIVAAQDFYDRVDVEIYAAGEPKDIQSLVDYLLDSDSEIRQLWWGETFRMEYDPEITKFMLGKQAYFCYLDFIQGRQTDFARELSQKFPKLNITIISTDIYRNYWCEDVFSDGRWELNSESTYLEEAPDIYREHLEEMAAP
jgi:hypothetical protein